MSSISPSKYLSVSPLAYQEISQQDVVCCLLMPCTSLGNTEPTSIENMGAEDWLCKLYLQGEIDPGILDHMRSDPWSSHIEVEVLEVRPSESVVHTLSSKCRMIINIHDLRVIKPPVFNPRAPSCNYHRAKPISIP